MRRKLRSKVVLFGVLALCGLLASRGSASAAQKASAEEKAQSDEAKCLASTIYWEARAASRKVMTAIAWVVLNRRHASGYPDTICAVVHQGGEQPPCQFSYWCDGAPEIPHNETAWKTAQNIATQMLENPPSDPTHGALFFHSDGVSPDWAREHKKTVRLGKYVFYK